MRRRLGAALLVLAVAAPAVRAARVVSVDWIPLDAPLPAAGRSAHDFTVDVAGAYELAVQIDRPAGRTERDAAECRVGFDWVECAGDDPMLTLQWGIHTADGRAVTCGAESAIDRVVEARSSSGHFTPSIARRWLGCADLRPGTRYVLEVEVPPGGPDVQALAPRLLLLPSIALDRGQYSTTAAIWLTSLVIGLAGVLLIWGA